jgi:hypothetical protein
LLRQVDVHPRLEEDGVGHQMALEQRGPLDTGLQAGDVRHRRLRVGVLPDHHVLERQRQVERTQVGMPQRHVVAVQLLVDLRLEIAAQGLVEMMDDEEHPERHHGGDQNPDQPLAAHGGVRPARGSRRGQHGLRLGAVGRG